MSNNSVLVSIIVPAYNIASYLPRCLDSILNQTYTNLEIIVISDGSTDGTNEIIKKYAQLDSRIIPVFKSNSGVSDTRNKGLDIAKGDYIGFVDGDDYIEPDMYEILVNNIVKYEADISHCGYSLLRKNDIVKFYGTGDLAVFDHDDGLRELLSGRRIEPGLCNKLYKSWLFSDLQYDKNIRINEDLLINAILFNKSKKTVFEDVTKYNYFVRENSASHSEINEYKLYDPIKVTSYILGLLKDSEQLYNVALERYISCNLNSYKLTYLNKLPSKREYKQFIKNNLKSQKKNFKFISRKNRFMCYGILYFDFLFCMIYKIYDFTHKGRNKHNV